MTKLSPAAQAVVNAYTSTPIKNGAKPALAAVLRAAVDQAVPEEPLYYGDQRRQFERDARQHCRQQLLAIAAELEAQ